MKSLMLITILFLSFSCSHISQESPEEAYLKRVRKTCMNKEAPCETKKDTVSFYTEKGVFSFETKEHEVVKYKENNIITKKTIKQNERLESDGVDVFDQESAKLDAKLEEEFDLIED